MTGISFHDQVFVDTHFCQQTTHHAFGARRFRSHLLHPGGPPRHSHSLFDLTRSSGQLFPLLLVTHRTLDGYSGRREDHETWTTKVQTSLRDGNFC